MPIVLEDFEQLRPHSALSDILAVTCDGGVGRINPSPYGGMWAFRMTGADRLPILQAVGIVYPSEVFPLTTVSNNLTETLAVLIALEYLPDGWAGQVRSDSQNALRVFQNYRDPKKVAAQGVWLTGEMIARVRRVRERLGALDFVLLGGHPHKAALAELHAGGRPLKKGKYPYCLDNVWCDAACKRVWEEHESYQP